MKKSLLLLTAALSFGVASAQTETPAAAPAAAPQVPTLTDVPAGHWAKDAIDRLVSQGIILGYPDGTYRGTQNLTRYEAAVIIARLLDQIRSGTTASSAIDPETLTALQNAIQELAADLAALGVRVSDLEENAVSRDDFTRLEERVETLSAGAGDSEALANLTAQIQELTARADDYDTLRADVDDAASSIAALNDLTVLLNQDILNLQDRVSAVEAAQADFVSRADFDTLSGRVGTVETRVTNIDNRVTQLERYAFTIRPSLSATYYVARGTRNMDFDRLIPGTVFSTGVDTSGDTADTAVDYADLTGGRVAVVNDAANYYGFSGAGNFGTTTTTGNAVRVEGSTSISFGITFGTASNTITSGRSATTGALVTSAGGLNVNSVDISFGIRAGLPTASTSYPDVVQDGVTYRPLFFFFNNATANFTVGNAPISVTFGKNLKFKYADYIGDNDKTGRGDGFIVNVDGSPVPVIGAFKPTLQFVYGSRSSAAATPALDGANSDNLYYRGVRATITPVGTLKAGVHVLQEGSDTFGAPAGSPTDVTAFGADLHGTVAGFQIDSETAVSRVTVGGTTTTQSAFYAKASGNIGSIARIYNLNYRTITAGYDGVAGISEADPGDTDNGSTAPYATFNKITADQDGNPATTGNVRIGDVLATSPFFGQYRPSTSNAAGNLYNGGQTGFGIKLGTTLGPVSLGLYYDNQVARAGSPLATALGTSGNPFSTTTDSTAIVDRGATAKVSLFNLVTVRGGYYEYLKGFNAFDRVNGVIGNGVRYNVRADVTPGFGLALGGYFRDLRLEGTRAQSDGGLFRNSRYNSYFPLTGNELTDQDGCGDQHPSIAGSDTDGVGGALTFSQRNFTDRNCYSEFGVELAHDGKDAAALVKNLSFRVGYASRYRNATNGYTNNFIYGDVLYGQKLGIAQVDVKGAFAVDGYTGAEAGVVPNSTATAFGVRVVTDPLAVIFRPSFEGSVGYYNRSYGTGTSVPAGGLAGITASGLKYVAGVKLNEFLLPNTKLAVYYAGYRGTNRAYVPFSGGTAGSFQDQNTGATVTQDLLYVEGNYNDLSFGYGVGNLGLNTGVATTSTSARGQVFKINYKVNF